MSKRTPSFETILAAGTNDETGPLRGAEIDAVIELGFLMASANGDASFDELDAFRALVKYLKPNAIIGTTLDELTAKLDAAESIEARVRALAPLLARPVARDLAYKAAYTIAVFDLETNEDERDLDDLLVEVFALSDRVEDLEAEVNEALST